MHPMPAGQVHVLIDMTVDTALVTGTLPVTINTILFDLC